MNAITEFALGQIVIHTPTGEKVKILMRERSKDGIVAYYWVRLAEKSIFKAYPQQLRIIA